MGYEFAVEGHYTNSGDPIITGVSIVKERARRSIPELERSVSDYTLRRERMVIAKRTIDERIQEMKTRLAIFEAEERRKRGE